METSSDTFTPVDLLADGIFAHDQKVVFILGAGASVSAGIPVGSQIGGALSSADQSILRNELGAGNWKFFDVIETLIEFRGEEQTQKLLRKLLKHKYVSLEYEIMSHYLSRGQINAVITLNHDDAFDTALNLEASEFTNILRSNSDFDAFLDRFGESAELPPAYLKLHGCVTKKATFRIRKHDVRELGAAKLQVFKKYLNLADLIVCIGWAMHDPDVFRPFCESMMGKDARKSLLIVEMKDKLQDIMGLVSGVNAKTCKVDAECNILSEAAENVERRYHYWDGDQKHIILRGEKDQGLNRHRIRHLCCGRDGVLNSSVLTQACVEVLMFAFKARTQIEPEGLLRNNRVTNLLEKLGERVIERAGSKIKERIENRIHIEYKKTQRETAKNELLKMWALYKVLKLLCNSGLLNCNENRYWINLPNVRYHKDTKAFMVDVAREFVWRLVGVANYCKGDIDLKRTDLKNNFLALVEGFDVELSPNSADFSVFRNATILGDHGAFYKATSELMKYRRDDRATVLFVSANTGEWLRFAFPEDQRFDIILLISNDYSGVDDDNPFSKIAKGRVEDVRSLLESKCRFFRRKVSNLKNEQMTAVGFLSDYNNNLLAEDIDRIVIGKFVSFEDVIYFRRERKATEVSPVRVSNYIAADPDLACNKEGANGVDMAVAESIFRKLWISAKLIS